MFKAILMRLFGLHPHWEVRSISQLTKKDLPGTRLYSGDSYRKARAAYKKEKARIKPDHKLKLQAVSVLAMHWKPSIEGIQEAINEEANKRLGNVAAVMPKVAWTEPEVQELKDKIEGEFPTTPGIAESNARQSEFMAENQDEPNAYNGEDHGDHECNFSGPMEMGDDGKYHPTCSICDTPQ